jgi:hypothetical protein
MPENATGKYLRQCTTERTNGRSVTLPRYNGPGHIQIAAARAGPVTSPEELPLNVI